MMGGFHMGGVGFWFILFLLFLVIGFIVLQTSTQPGSSSTENHQKPKGQPKTAVEIARERYANGEISREEYTTIVEDLEGDHAPG